MVGLAGAEAVIAVAVMFGGIGEVAAARVAFVVAVVVVASVGVVAAGVGVYG